MSTDVRVPATGNAGEDAVVADWNVSVGDQVSAGDVLVVLETAKATLDVEAPVSGEVLKIFYAEGDEAPEHEVLVILGEPGETFDPGAPHGGVAADGDDMGATAPAHPSPGVVIEGAAEPVPGSGERPARISASPRAKKLASEKGIPLTQLAGSGPGGRIVIADVLGATPTPPAAPPATPAASPAAAFTVVPVRGARKATAHRMLASLQSTAQLTLTRYATGDALLGYLSRLRTVTEAAGLPRIGVNDALLFATARAVAKHPEANSWFDWDGIRQFSAVNLGFAVDTGQALLVPVIPGADRLTLAELAARAQAAIAKARGGRLTAPETEGGTFTVSNLGGLGVHWFTPVLNPPQSCILGVGAAHKTSPDAPALFPLSLTFDHRALDGAAAAAVLGDIAASIETVDVLAAF